MAGFRVQHRTITAAELGMGLAALAAFALMAWYTLRFHAPVPFGEHFQMLDMRDRWFAGTYRFMQGTGIYGGNWGLIGTNLALMLSLVTRWNLQAEAAVIVLLVAATFGIWAWVIARYTPDRRMRLALLALAAISLFSLNQIGNLLWTWQIYLFLHNAGLMLTIATLAVRDYRFRHFLLALTGAVLAVYDVTTGLALLPAYALGLWLHPAARRWLWLWLPLSAAMAAHTYLALRMQMDTSNITNSLSMPLSLDSAFFLAKYIFVFLSLPLVVGAQTLGYCVGAAAFALCLWANWQLIFGRCRHNRLRFLPAVILMDAVVGGMLIIAIGRHGPGVSILIMGRYYTFANLFWLAACLLLAGRDSLMPAWWRQQAHAHWKAALALVCAYSLTTLYAFDRNHKILDSNVVEFMAHLGDGPHAAWTQAEQAMFKRVPVFVGKHGEQGDQLAYFDRLYRQRLGVFRNVPRDTSE